MMTMAIFVFVALGLGGCSANKQNPTTTSDQPPVAAESTPSQAQSSESLRNLMRAGKTVICGYTDTASNTSGSIKIDSNQVRGDFTVVTAEGQSNVSHMISDGTTMYIWSDDQGNQGMKYDLSAMPTPAAGAQTPTGQPQPLDLDKQYSYQCAAWTVDPAEFNPPSTIQFQDLSKLMQNLLPKVTGLPTGGENTSGNSAACAACASLTGDAKTKCTQALGCD
jgi:hypothetical protein